MFFGVDDTQPDMYVPENRETVKFDFFNGSEKSRLASKKTLQNFESENSFFNSIIYGLMHKNWGKRETSSRKSKRYSWRKTLWRIKGRNKIR